MTFLHYIVSWFYTCMWIILGLHFKCSIITSVEHWALNKNNQNKPFISWYIRVHGWANLLKWQGDALIMVQVLRAGTGRLFYQVSKEFQVSGMLFFLSLFDRWMRNCVWLWKKMTVLCPPFWNHLPVSGNIIRLIR